MAICYSVAEYCCPVWRHSAHVKLVDTRLNHTMRLISGTLKPTQLPWLPVLAKIAPRHLRRKAAADTFLSKVELHPDWPIYSDIFNPPNLRLQSRHPLWRDKVQTDIKMEWRELWQLANVVHNTLVEDPTIQQPGFHLPRRSWSALNCFRTEQGLCAANLHQWHMIPSDNCRCGQRQTMTHIVNDCPHTRLADDGLSRLHSADAHAIKWLDEVAIPALAR